MRILLVDDERLQLEMLEGFLRHRDYAVATATSGTEALAAMQSGVFDLVLLDHNMPGMRGDELLRRILEINPLQAAIMITAFGAVETAVRVMKMGAVDFLEKPVDLQMLQEKIEQLEEKLLVANDAAEIGAHLDEQQLPLTLIGSGQKMQQLLSMVRRVAPSPLTVLIHGETGTGKELIARLIHQLSPRRQYPFVEVNCAAIPENLFESELFGHEKGAFTGAGNRRQGRFEAANEGTIFLDEVGELPLNLQAKLLRALQEKRITPVGSDREREIDVRVLAATNRDLARMVREGSFREDLFYRLNVLELELPPLRQRKEDLPELIEHFLQKHSPRPLRLGSEAQALLLRYTYPGNVRELEHLLQRTVTLARAAILRPADLPEMVRNPPPEATDQTHLDERLAAVEREMLLTALEANQWVQTRAAASLGVSERVLRYKIDKYGIKRD